jgi:exopolysaccharide biosynthesis polyprenyl glycosylphosphotransferase
MKSGAQVSIVVQGPPVRPITLLSAVSPVETPDVAARPATWKGRLTGVSLGCLTGLVVAAVYGKEVGTAAVGLLLWALLLGLQTSSRRWVLATPGAGIVHTAVLSFTAVGVAAAGDVLPARGLGPTLIALVAATIVTSAWSLTHRVRRPVVRALLVGDRTALDAQVALWSEQPGLTVVACHDPAADKSGEGASGEALADIVTALGIDTVIVTPGACLSSADLQRLSWELESTKATIVVGGVVDRFAPHRLAAGTLAGVPVLTVGSSRRGRLENSVKSALDRVGAALLLVLAFPVIGVMALVLRLESPGPAFFKQKRVGLSGEPFVMYKMRTMHSSGGALPSVPLKPTAGNEVLFKMRDDPRVTRVGGLLRRYSLDELPQLINVVRGEMSLIGPRPALYEETEKYDSRAWRRTAVKPGITGLWQVSGRSDLSWEKSISLDLHYVDNWRLSDDLSIAARTFWAVVRKKGAY